MIPKIIHHIAPKDKSRWHPLWSRCYPSWKDKFPDFKHILWNDEEDMDELVKNKWPEYYDMYQDFPAHLMRIEVGRLAMLYHYGGFYVDMDVYCYHNFYNELKDDLYIMEAPFGEESLENALMISSKNNPFWLHCIEETKRRYYDIVKKKKIKIPFNNDKRSQYLITATAGSNLVSSVFKKLGMPTKHILPGHLFNNHGLSFHPAFRTKHLLTGLWGKEAIDKLDKDSNGNYQASLSNWYINDVKQYANLPENITVDKLDFYKDYTNGGFLKQSNFDINKVTDIEEVTKNW